jgi:hypothetical protein
MSIRKPLNEESPEQAKRGKWLAGIYCWRVKDGFFRRQLQPAIIECVDGSKITINMELHTTARGVMDKVKRIVQYYRHEMPIRNRKVDKQALERSARFVLPSPDPTKPPVVDITLNAREAKSLGVQLVAYAERAGNERILISQ